MSKSKGNTIDPLDVIDGIAFEALLEKSTQGLMLAAHKETAAKRIKREFPEGIDAYGADALRFTFASLSTLGRTLNFDLKRCEGYRSFCNKLWNATRFVLMNTEGKDTGLDESKPRRALGRRPLDREPAAARRGARSTRRSPSTASTSRRARSTNSSGTSTATGTWRSPRCRSPNGNEAQQRGTRRTLIRVLETTLRLAHPFIPFITEELWQKVAPLAGQHGRKHHDGALPAAEPAKIDEEAEAEVALWQEQVDATRNLRPPTTSGQARKSCSTPNPSRSIRHWQHAPWVALARLSEIRIGEVPQDIPTVSTATSNGTLSLALPAVDKDAERARLAKDIAKLEPQIEVARARLGNSSFVDRAPAKVIEETRRQLAEQEAKLADMRSQLGKLG